MPAADIFSRRGAFSGIIQERWIVLGNFLEIFAVGAGVLLPDGFRRRVRESVPFSYFQYPASSAQYGSIEARRAFWRFGIF